MNQGQDLWGPLLANSPWAAMAGFLLWQVIKAWTGDRAQVTSLLGEFKSTLDRLSVSVDALTRRLDESNHTASRLTDKE